MGGSSEQGWERNSTCFLPEGMGIEKNIHKSTSVNICTNQNTRQTTTYAKHILEPLSQREEKKILKVSTAGAGGGVGWGRGGEARGKGGHEGANTRVQLGRSGNGKKRGGRGGKRTKHVTHLGGNCTC